MTFAAAIAAADRAALAHLGGAAVVYQPELGVPVEVSGIFDAAYVKVDIGGSGVSSTAPAVWLLLADLPVDPEEDTPRVTTGGTVYRVREVQKDGMGGVLLMLTRAE